MARTPRPVDPEDGPVQAFAHELRCLRERNGATPYRVLARTAGYSATTLGDAAGGVRLPTLDVALAYAVACGGDPVWWEQRWTEASRLLTAESEVAGNAGDPSLRQRLAEAPVADAGADPGADLISDADPGAGQIFEADPGPAVGSAIARGRRRWFAGRWVIVPAGVLAIGVAAMLAMHGSSAPDVTAATGPMCSGARPAAVAFTGTTSSTGANVRSGASLEDAVVEQLPADCEVQFSGYCLGDVVHDLTGGSPDMRWFILGDHEVVASAVIHGNPPAGLRPTACADDVPAPTSLSFSVIADPSRSKTLTLRATGAHLAIVGYASFYADAQAPRGRWHQIGVIADLATEPNQPWQLPAATAGRSGSVLVFAAACLGGQAPIGVGAAGMLTPHPGSAPAVAPASLDAAQFAAADAAACAYPTA